MCYNNKAVAKTGQRNGHWKLNNEERSTSIKYVRERNSKISERKNTTQTKVREAKKKALEQIWTYRKVRLNTTIREFDPGSGWTLAACITHSSRTELFELILREAFKQLSGGRVSNAWATCLCEGDNVGKLTLIPHYVWEPHDFHTKDFIAQRWARVWLGSW